MCADANAEYLAIAVDAYRNGVGANNPHMLSSNFSDAWILGKTMRESGRSEPRNIRKSRGYTWFVNDMKFDFAKDSANPVRIS